MPIAEVVHVGIAPSLRQLEFDRRLVDTAHVGRERRERVLDREHLVRTPRRLTRDGDLEGITSGTSELTK